MTERAADPLARSAARRPGEEADQLRLLARQMAAIVDTEELLIVLCDAAAAQCHGTGAAVLKIIGREGMLVAGTGRLLELRGRRFTLAGSLVREVVRTRDVVAVDDFTASGRPLTRVVPELSVGPMLLAPLIAHDAIVGIIAVSRDRAAPPFTSDEARRLCAIADHAALALWKAELYDRAQAADQAKSRFLATISHELRTPLTALAGYEELLADQVVGPLSAAQLELLERMRSVTQHLSGMIEEVLTFASLEEGRQKVRPTELLAADLVRSAAAIIEPLARQKNIRLVAIVPDEPIRMTSDVDKLRQILVNLAGNAVKFTDEGEVRLVLAPGDGLVRFIVEDTGIGIEASDLQRLFQPFSQLDTGLTRRHGGTGLGLHIARELAHLLGGAIEVESTLGEGSTFTLIVPTG